MPFEAKLASVVKLFRLFPNDDNIPPKLRTELLYKPGIFLFNLKHNQTSLGVPLSIRFDPSMLNEGDFLPLAKQIVTKTRKIISPKSRDLLATTISQYLKSSFRFHKVITNNRFHVEYCPNTLVFMVDILLLDLKKYVEDNDEKGEFDDATQPHHSYLNIDSNVLVSIGGSNNKYANLEIEDVEILQLWLSNYIKDFGGGLLNGKIITQDIIQNTFLKFNPTLQLVQSKEFDEDMICSICLEKLLSSDEDDNIMLVRCKHVYHSNCLFKWLPNNPLCPYCRSVSLTPILIG